MSKKNDKPIQDESQCTCPASNDQPLEIDPYKEIQLRQESPCEVKRASKP